MRVSVIIPTCNEAAYLRKCLDSIAAQTRLPDEVLVLIDEKTTDESESIASGHPLRPRIIHGFRDTFTLQHRGVLEATGDIVVNVDADTYLSPDWIEKAVEWLRNSEISLVTGYISPHVHSRVNDWICSYQNGNSGYVSGCSSAMRKGDYLRLCEMLGGPQNIEFAYYPFHEIGTVIKDGSLQAETDIPTSKQKMLFLGAGLLTGGAATAIAAKILTSKR